MEALIPIMTARLSRIIFALVFASSVLFVGCGDSQQDLEPMDADTVGTGMGDDMTQMDQTATAELSPTEGNNVSGTVTFTSLNGAVRVEADIEHLAPGSHGFHIHETGDCSAPDASSAGGHFNPEGAPHGAPTDSVRHVGDLGNIESGADSTATYSRVDSVLTLSGANSIIDRAVVVHEGEDDLTSQPSGDAGARVACGVIESDGGEGADMPAVPPAQP